MTGTSPLALQSLGITHKVYREAIDILKTVDDYKSAKRRVLYRMKYTIMCKNITM